MSDPELQDFLFRSDQYLQNKLSIRRRYESLYRRFLNLRQIAHLYVAEDRFARQLVQYRIKKGLSD